MAAMYTLIHVITLINFKGYAQIEIYLHIPEEYKNYWWF